MAKRNLLLGILDLLLLCFLLIDATAASPSSSLSKPNCADTCGNIKIPFPFGMGRRECFFDEWYKIDCRNETSPKPFLQKLKLEVHDISLRSYRYNWTGRYYDGTSQYITVNFPIKYSHSSCYPKGVAHHQPPNLQDSPFFFSSGGVNAFAAVGCNVNAQMTSNYSFVGCKLECSGGNHFSTNTTCSGFDGCCQTVVPYGLQNLTDVEFNSFENVGDYSTIPLN